MLHTEATVVTSPILRAGVTASAATFRVINSCKPDRRTRRCGKGVRGTAGRVGRLTWTASSSASADQEGTDEGANVNGSDVGFADGDTEDGGRVGSADGIGVGGSEVDGCVVGEDDLPHSAVNWSSDA